jgi:hypothetical protein
LTPSLTGASTTYTINDDYKFSYNFNEANTEINFLVEATAEGYVALGFGSSMTNADIIIIQFNGADPPSILDCWSTGHSTPSQDSQQDVTLLDHDVSASKKIVKFKRLLNTGDSSKDTVITKGASTSMIWSMKTSSGASITKHSSKGIFTTSLDVVLPVPTLTTSYDAIVFNSDFQFKYNFVNSNTEIEFLVEVTAEGYAALGFGTGMSGADIIIIQFNGASSPTILDCKGSGHSLPATDST